MQTPKLLILGASQSTGNLGVSALGVACVHWLSQTDLNADCVLQSGRERCVKLSLQNGTISLPTIDLHQSDQIRARHGTRHLQLLNRILAIFPKNLRRYISPFNSTLDAILSCNAVLDVSAGDSFAEIYIPQQFESQCAIKELIIKLKKPLILLPQTFGPFETNIGRDRAKKILSAADLVITRELNGLTEIEDSLNLKLDHRFASCPDMAFGLPVTPFDTRDEPFLRLLKSTDSLIGLNVSGLLYNEEDSFGTGTYIDLIDQIINWAMLQPEVKLLLVPHVFPYDSGGASHWVRDDRIVCDAVFEKWASIYPGRIGKLYGSFDATEIKWAIGHCNFFIGARMHACIAAISQAIPTATLAYSKKVEGVLGLAGVGNCAVDIRQKMPSAVVSEIQEIYRQRLNIKQLLQQRMQTVRKEIETCFNTVIVPVINKRFNEKRKL